MTKYIDKDALVADIERRKSEHLKHNNLCDDYYVQEDNAILSFINTLEVKEVDLEKEMDKYFDEHDVEFCRDEYLDYAKHFFELGLLSTITEEDCKLICNIGDDLPYMPEEDFFKELLKRFKAQKGE